MLIEYRVLRVEFRNYKLLSLFTGILCGGGGGGFLDSNTLTQSLEGSRRGGKKIVRECKLTAGGSGQANTQMFVSTWQGWGGGGLSLAEHELLASAAQEKHASAQRHRHPDDKAPLYLVYLAAQHPGKTMRL